MAGYTVWLTRHVRAPLVGQGRRSGVGSGLISADEGTHLSRATIGSWRQHQARGAHDEDEVGLSTAATAGLEGPCGSDSPEPDHARLHQPLRTLRALRRRDLQAAGLLAASRRHDQPLSRRRPALREHRKATMLPCRWTTSALPARRAAGRRTF